MLRLHRFMPVVEMEGDENQLTFGQIVPLLTLASTVMVFWEAFGG